MKKYWKPVTVGLLTYLFISYFATGVHLLFGFVIKVQPPQFFSEIVIFFSSTFNMVIPGLVVGYLAKESGILLGLIVGLLGASIYYFLTPLSFVDPSATTYFIKQIITILLMNAVAGGCGELIRMKRASA